MPQLPEKAIDEFQTLWKEHYGEDLLRDEAVGRARQVFSLVQLLTKTRHEHQKKTLLYSKNED